MNTDHYDHLARHAQDPVKFTRWLWPDVTLYQQQADILESVRDNDSTIVVAGNMLGKDFTAGIVVLWFFLTRSPCRIVTTSADHSQLEAVLWGEVRRFINTAQYPLDHRRGGPLVVNHLQLRRIFTTGPRKGQMCPRSYVVGRTAAKGEGMLGHHIEETGDGVPRTLFIADEASGVDDLSWERASTWARRMLAIGNPFPCENFFKKGVKGGDLVKPAHLGV